MSESTSTPDETFRSTVVEQVEFGQYYRKQKSVSESVYDKQTLVISVIQVITYISTEMDASATEGILSISTFFHPKGGGGGTTKI